MKIISEIKQKLLSSNHTAIVCHQNPDGDTLGSAFALYEALKSKGIQSSVLCVDNLPHKYEFLSNVPIENYYHEGKYDLIVFVDCAELKLTGNLFNDIQLDNIDTINIDHHGTNVQYAVLNLVDSSYSSTAELIYELILEIEVNITKKMADALYTGVVTDTGQFAFSYTSARTHKIAASLIECGADFSSLHKILFRTSPYSKLLLTKLMLENMCLYEDDAIAISTLTLENFEEADSTPQESESLVNMLVSIEGVKAAVLARQIGEDEFKISFRSADNIDISKAAKLLGGGGHKQAAGATIESKADKVADDILQVILKSGAIK